MRVVMGRGMSWSRRDDNLAMTTCASFTGRRIGRFTPLTPVVVSVVATLGACASPTFLHYSLRMRLPPFPPSSPPSNPPSSQPSNQPSNLHSSHPSSPRLPPRLNRPSSPPL